MLKGERGVTLIELIVALAIAGLLASSVLFGRDQLLGRQQFAQGVDQVVETLSSARNQANSTVGSTNPSNGGTSNNYIFAKTAALNAGTIVIATEIVQCGNPPNCDSPGDVAVGGAGVDPYTVKIPWEVQTAPPVNLLFAFETGGRIKAYYGPSLPTQLQPNTNGMTMITSPVVVANLSDAHGYTATITVDQFGNITRKIN